MSCRIRKIPHVAYLSRHDGPRGHVPNLAHSSAIPMAEIPQDLQVLPLEVEFVFDPDLQLRGLPGTLAPAASGHLEIALGGSDCPRSGCRQRKALHILPFQRAS
jgi:hypothetical protein